MEDSTLPRLLGTPPAQQAMVSLLNLKAQGKYIQRKLSEAVR